MKKALSIVILFLAALNTCRAQDFTNLFFLHHSVGNGLVVEGNMRAAIAVYNSAQGTHYGFWDHGYNADGLRNPAGEETGINYDIPDDNTNPDGLYYLWTSSDAEYAACRDLIIANHQVIAFKSCYPASAIPDEETLNTYKSYYLAMHGCFDLYPERLFIVMSTPPLHRLATNATEGYYARAFANWLKSADYLSGHTNVVCFDLFGYLAGSDNFLKYEYESSHTGSDSHPNAFADEIVGPVFALFLIDSAAAYHPSGTNLPAPANVLASDGTYTNKVRVSWNSVSGATSYQVWRNTVNASSSANLLVTIADTTYDDTTATTPGLMLYYWVKAQNDSGVSAFSQPNAGYCGTNATSGKPAAGDINGTGLADLISVVGSNWYVWFSSSGYLQRIGPCDLGISGTPITGDIDGDGKADLISVVGSSWYVWLSSSGYLQRIGPCNLGVSGTPVTGDIDGDGKADLISVVGSNWYVWLSSSGYLQRIGPCNLGLSGLPTTGDIDGDGLADLISVVGANWYVWLSSSGYLQRIGPYDLIISGTPVTGDIDGDRLADFIIVVGSDWYVWFSTSQYLTCGGPYTLNAP